MFSWVRAYIRRRKLADKVVREGTVDVLTDDEVMDLVRSPFSLFWLYRKNRDLSLFLSLVRRAKELASRR